MKTIKILSAVALASMISSSALAESGKVYARIDAGYALSKAEIKGAAKQNIIMNGFAGNVGLGYYFTDSIRMDVNFGFTPSHSINVKRGGLASNNFRMSGYTGMVNAYYDFIGAEIIPYITAGVGTMNSKASVTGPNATKFKSKTGFAYQAGLGAAFELTTGAFLDLGYRFTGNSLPKSSANGYSFKPTAFTHTFLLGGRLNF